MAIYLDVKVGESISIDNSRVVITLSEKSGQRARLKFETEPGIRVEQMDRRQTHPAAGGLGPIKKYG